MRHSISPLTGQSEPFQRLEAVLRNLVAHGMLGAKIPLRPYIPLLGSHAIPIRRLLVFLGNTPAVVIHETKVVLRDGIPHSASGKRSRHAVS